MENDYRLLFKSAVSLEEKEREIALNLAISSYTHLFNQEFLLIQSSQFGLQLVLGNGIGIDLSEPEREMIGEILIVDVKIIVIIDLWIFSKACERAYNYILFEGAPKSTIPSSSSSWC